MRLKSLDRLASDELAMTQELIANMLGIPARLRVLRRGQEGIRPAAS
jgi:hypothetical protein